MDPKLDVLAIAAPRDGAAGAVEADCPTKSVVRKRISRSRLGKPAEDLQSFRSSDAETVTNTSVVNTQRKRRLAKRRAPLWYGSPIPRDQMVQIGAAHEKENTAERNAAVASTSARRASQPSAVFHLQAPVIRGRGSRRGSLTPPSLNAKPQPLVRKRSRSLPRVLLPDLDNYFSFTVYNV